MRFLRYHGVLFVITTPLVVVILGLYARLSVDSRVERAVAEQTTILVSNLSSHSWYGSSAATVETAAENHSENQEPQGHVFIYSSLEEQTNGARNIWQLEMWAKQVNMTAVAEPFAVNSMFGVMGAIPSFTSLRFGDYFDKGKWNKMVNKYSGCPLVEWEEFVSTAPRQAIVLYTLLRTKKPGQEPEPGLNVSYGEDDVKKYKPGKYEQITNSDMLWIKRNFNITRIVTFVHNAAISNPLTLEEYNSYVFGDLNPSQVTLICVNWIGIGVTKFRIQIRSAPASFLKSIKVEFKLQVNSSGVSPVVSPSPKIMKAYQAYISQYFGNRKYIAAVFRTFTVMYYHHAQFPQQSKYLLECSKKLKHELNKVRNKWEIFLAYDLGVFGSGVYSYFNSSHEKQVIRLQNQILSDVYSGSPQRKQRDARLIKAAGGITDRGFIALLEKTIATHADCIVLLGVTSSFVQSSANMYMSLHKINPCVVSICSEKFINAKGKVVSSDHIPAKFLH
ncbi:uncharacterized protein [Dysidea avara]|uniref:uncharacterized protein n=1 Tax=Dysidea avara TaxID=196820 RepID=UPI003327DDC4